MLFLGNALDDADDRVMHGMAKRGESRHHAARCDKLLNRSGKNQERFFGRLFADADLAPAIALPIVLDGTQIFFEP